MGLFDFLFGKKPEPAPAAEHATPAEYATPDGPADR